MDAKKYDNRPYRPNVGIMLINDNNQIWSGKRVNNDNYLQMPQGGIDKNENIISAMWRELNEEISITKNDAIILDYHKKWIKYDLPYDISQKLWNGKYRGQKQKWFALKLINNIIDINTEIPEFTSWKWVKPKQLIENSIKFKKNVYEQVIYSFKDILNI